MPDTRAPPSPARWAASDQHHRLYIHELLRGPLISRVVHQAPDHLQVMRPAGEQDGQPRYLVIVHVAADHAFKAVLSRASAADMPLFRGMFLTIRLNKTAVAAPAPTDVAVHQAFLPKFENEAQDAHVADAIVEQAGARYMVATVKHSGSLATLSHDLVGAKNSVRNEFTAVAVVLLRAHYERLATQDRYAAHAAAAPPFTTACNLLAQL